MEKFKVINTGRAKVNINLVRLNGKTVPVMAGGFAYLTQDELAYVRNGSKVFEIGTLKVDKSNPAPDELDIPESPNALTDDEIKKIARQTKKKIENDIKDISSVDTMERILEAAKAANKTVGIITMIENKIAGLR